MYEPLEIAEEKMEKTLSSLAEDYSTIRAGRANPNVLNKITVDYYGSPTPLQQVANISVPEARMLVIQPWDRSLSKDVKKKGEAAKVAIRNIRRDCVDTIKKAQKAGEITEDDQKKDEDEAQKLTDKYIGKVDKAVEAKTKEIMTV